VEVRLTAMIGFLRRWRETRARVREAERRALAAFHETDSRPHWGTWIVRNSADDIVVRVMFGERQPPERRWFLVPGRADVPVRELALNDVVPMGETTAWR
jgi:hypothetical protein